MTGCYATEVFEVFRDCLIGDLDGQQPRLVVTGVERVQSAEDVLVANVVVGFEGDEIVHRVAFDEWEDYTDRSAASMGAGLAVLAADEIREALSATE